jgi:membrane peptidoglycan carboxypeptidase
MTSDNGISETNELQPKKKRNILLSRTALWIYPIAVASGLGAAAAVYEAHTSHFQAQIFNSAATGEKYTRTVTNALPPATGPYDERLGYTLAADFRQRLLDRGYTLAHQATWQDREIAGIKLFPIYNEKQQAGLQITDDNNDVIYQARYPNQTFPDYKSIPEVLVKSLLYVENRELDDEHPDTWNPVIDWGRLFNASLGHGMRKLGLPGDRSGASTLATQIEKFRHSPDGRTTTGSEKIQQMFTASVRAYGKGQNTVEARHDIVLQYLNSMPLAAYPKFGEVNGYGDAMAVWFGVDMKEASEFLSRPESELSDAEMQKKAQIYRQSLSLIMAVKKPSAFLRNDRAGLEMRVNNFLRPLAADGVISERLRDMALAEKTFFPDPSHLTTTLEAHKREKSVDSLRVELMQTMKVPGGLYHLDRMDVSANATVDGKVSAEVTKILKSLNDPETAKAAGLTGFQLLRPDAVGNIVYSFVLYEKTAEGNVLRVETDNFDGPLNLNEGSKLELGSTAKVRTLVSYLEAIADLHGHYSGKDAMELQSMIIRKEDNLSRWAADYLSNPETDKSLNAMLEASLDRTYSANPGERFFTGGGVHTFNNFDRKDNGGTFTVKKSLHNSLNLPFVRIMRDVVNYTMSHKMNIDPELFENPDSAQRLDYLQKFADSEGTGFMWKFWNRQQDKNPQQVLDMLTEKVRKAPTPLAVLYRTIYPDAPVEEMEKYITANCTSCGPKTNYQKLYDQHAPGKFNLNDRGYLTRVHPLHLWMAEYKIKNSDATWSQTVEASKDVRQETYKWLFQPGKFGGQNTRIRTMVEREAFTHIQKTWAELGFPFENMVPSYASALGASGDTPSALAKLVGILQNDGIRKESHRFREIQFGKDTPYAMEFNAKSDEGRRVLPVEITNLVRREMQNVVELGTGRRVKNAIKLADGTVLQVGAKTGTGDNRQQTFSAGGGVTSSNAKSRTATFVFMIDDRFYGCVTSYIEGPEANKHKFTSALSSQLFKTVIPAIMPIIERSYEATPKAVPEQNNEEIVTAENKTQKKPTAPVVAPR